MHLFIFKGESFVETRKFDVSIFQKREHKYMYIRAKSGHAKHIIKTSSLGNYKDTLDTRRLKVTL